MPNQRALKVEYSKLEMIAPESIKTLENDYKWWE